MPATWGNELAPGVPADTLSWFALIQATSSLRFVAGIVVLPTSRNGLLGKSATGSKSFSTSNGRE